MIETLLNFLTRNYLFSFIIALIFFIIFYGQRSFLRHQKAIKEAKEHNKKIDEFNQKMSNIGGIDSVLDILKENLKQSLQEANPQEKITDKDIKIEVQIPQKISTRELEKNSAYIKKLIGKLTVPLIFLAFLWLFFSK